VDTARRGDSVAISIEGPTFGRQLEEGQVLFTVLREEDYKLLTKQYSNLINDEERALLEQIHKLTAKETT
jgi:translation initiation factor 5B